MPPRPLTASFALALSLGCAPAGASTPPAPEPVPAAPPAPVIAMPAAGVPALPDTAADPARVYEGWKQFHIHCFRCHGFDAEGGGAPDLREAVRHRLTRPGFIVTVLGGRPERGMPAWGEVVPPAEAEQIYEYVVERATGRLPTGRPPRPE